MNAVERIQAAIDKLNAERDASTPPTDGPAWIQGRADHRFERTSEVYTGPDSDTDGSADVVSNSEPADAALIVTLHRAIDAQLAILTDFLNALTQMARPWEPPVGNPTMALADAILGPDPQ